MTRKSKIFLAIMLLLFTVLVTVQHFVPTPADWSLSFNGYHKSPYGCSINRDLLPLLFPGKDITENSASFYAALTNDTLSNKNLIIISEEFNPDELDLSAMLNFASRGNRVFISALAYSDKLCDTLGFRTNMQVIDTSLFKPGEEALRLTLPGTGCDTLFVFHKRMPEYRFTRYDTLGALPLGRDKSGNVNFIAMNFGKGRIYLHCQPMAFTNYHILYGNYQYAPAALSCLPVTETIWDQYYKSDRITDMSPVRYILSQPPLRSAYFLLLVTLLIYMVIGSKRMQRIIPVIRPEQNTSLDFVITAGKLYYRSQNHTDLARKKMMYFYDFIRTRYFMAKPELRVDQIRLLSQRSGVEEGTIKHLLELAGGISEKERITAQELTGLHEAVENFYKNCK